MALQMSVKHRQISKAQSNLMIVIAIATIVSIFSLFAFRSMAIKFLYQNRAINEKNQVVKQLEDNYTAAQTLIGQYQVFADSNPNILGGSVDGQGNHDGDNSRIVLDALPSKYDAPALATSIEKVLTGRNVSITSIELKDDAVSNPDEPQSDPKAQPLVFAFNSESTYLTARKLILDFERSIRPFDITGLELGGKDNQFTVKATASTYYQPAKSLNLEAKKEVE
jgi:hypothetical protein